MARVIAELLIFFALLSLATTIVILLPGAVNSRIWFGLPLGAIAAGAAAGVLYELTGDFAAAGALSVLALVFGLVRRALRKARRCLAAQLRASTPPARP